jgi:hypothetical protein
MKTPSCCQHGIKPPDRQIVCEVPHTFQLATCPNQPLVSGAYYGTIIRGSFGGRPSILRAGACWQLASATECHRDCHRTNDDSARFPGTRRRSRAEKDQQNRTELHQLDTAVLEFQDQCRGQVELRQRLPRALSEDIWVREIQRLSMVDPYPCRTQMSIARQLCLILVCSQGVNPSI